ncbi:hypothetical protein D1X48_14995 [Salmonella enterica]|nr:hypothetical protein [Salmonella enterica]MLR77472.1 hypothetical protein [Salmonella enterica subsp. salamae]HCM2004257.1 hypothetical protein [Salmonella enterica subsp. salamae serovar 21:z10:[z6]]
MMPVAQPKTNDLVGKIKPSLVKGELLLSPFELRLLARDADKIPVPHHRWCIQGMLAFLNNDDDEGIRLCEQSIEFDPSVAQTWCNYASALRYRHLLEKEWEVINRSLEFKGLLSVSYANTLAAYWMDIELLNRTADIIGSMEMCKRFNDVQNNLFGNSMVTRQLLLDAGSSVASDLRALAAIVRQVADQERLPRLKRRVSCHEGEYAYVYTVDTEDVEYLIKLDDLLFDSIVAAGVKSKNCIAFFEPKSEDND